MNEQFSLANKVVRPGKRFLAALADILILFILTSGIYSILVYPLIGKMPHYQELVTLQEQGIESCKQMYIDGKLMEFDIEPSDYVDKCIKSRLDSSDNDIFIHFYTVYMLTLHKSGEAIDYRIESINETVFNYSNQAEPHLWELKENDKTKPLELTATAKTMLAEYFNGNVTKETESYYTNMSYWFKNALVSAEKALTGTDEYQEKYSLTIGYNTSLYLYVSISSIITYTLFFFLYYLLVPALFKNGQTVGKKIMKIGLYTEDNKGIAFGTLLPRSILEYVSYFFLVMLVPIFQTGTSIINLPLFVFKTFSINLFVLVFVSLFISLISLVMCIASAYKQTLHDKIARIYAFRMDVQLEEENIIKNEEVLGKKEEDDSGSDIY